ncbi:DUF2314 domain-containing protein [Blastopirellula sp. JC732]|uniref:DUF2314 domain-containing protein n=1 Tax=Blastopirellula sediminis TaxID=2894196 RepID=A0A9X1SFQ5_9BACT|nr:DUF2314 domain-containing protein [Blastopirellula sediminis]MCC9609221.1 DUF2314 domain-containing protein [Blastopirellula sediminis]MCC9628002.1 DUF2314 domain-containing protein [Blastopirellula sediminis]
MESDSDDLVPVFMPALVVLLVHAEDKKGTPLTKEEVNAIRDKGACIMMDAARARKMDDSRGYRDIDPKNCWHDWQMARREMGREPEIDPGPRFNHVRSSDPAYQQTIADAHQFLSRFRDMLPADGTPRPDALVKTRIADGDNVAFMWLSNAALDGDTFTAELFEVPDSLPNYRVGDRLTVTLKELMDWMVNENGRLTGGFSLRYSRDRMTEDEKQDFDQHIGVTEYL